MINCKSLNIMLCIICKSNIGVECTGRRHFDAFNRFDNDSIKVYIRVFLSTKIATDHFIDFINKTHPNYASYANTILLLNE